MQNTHSVLPQFSYDTYLVRRKVFKLFGAAFHIYNPDGEVAFYSKQKAFKLKEDIRVYTSEEMTTEALIIQARNIIDFSATYDVIDPASGNKIGAVQRKGMKSIFKDEWIFMNSDDKIIGTIKEDSAVLALIRRFLTNLIPQTFHGESEGKEVCIFKQKFNPFIAKVELDFSMDNEGILDRRLGIACAVLLSAIEGKQQSY